MLRIKIIFFVLITTLVFFTSCMGGIYPSQNLKKQQFEREKTYNNYALCIFAIHKNEWMNDIGYQSDTIICCASLGLLYEKMNVKVFDEDTFIKRVYGNEKSGASIQVSPELFSYMYEYKVGVDEEIKSTYDRDGIYGVVSYLATRPIRDWEKNNYEKFKYIVYLCWQNNLFLYEHLNDEVFEFKWFVTGNKSLMKRYYSLSDKDVWFNPLVES